MCPVRLLRGILWGLLLVVSQAYAQPDADATADTDASCAPFTGQRQSLAAARESRLETNLFDGLEGKRIRHIQFKTISVFDPDNPRDNKPLYLWLNKLHTNTRPGVVRAQLLFKEGERLLLRDIAESERLLRSRHYLTNAYILPLVVCDTQVDLMVVTQDAWALEPQFSVSRKSADTQTSYALEDGNFLGTGSNLRISYSQSELRNLVGYDISNPHLFNSQLSGRLYYADTSDGRNSIVQLERPFESLATPWAAGIYREDTVLTDSIRLRDQVINEYRHFTELSQVFIGRASVQRDHSQRWLLGFSREQSSYIATAETLGELPTDVTAEYPWVEYQLLENRYTVYKNVNQIQRPEDIGLGHQLRLRLGYGSRSWNNPDDVWRWNASYQYLLDVDELHIMALGLMSDGHYYKNLDGLNSQVNQSYLSYNYFIDEKNRWYFWLGYDQGHDLAQHQELTSGDITGLRGYPTDFQRGNQRYRFSIERRYFSDIHLFSILRLGAVAFFDTGKSWGLREYRQSPQLSNIGLGLRLSSSRVKIGTVAHLDIATPLTQKQGISEYQITFGASQQF